MGKLTQTRQGTDLPRPSLWTQKPVSRAQRLRNSHLILIFSPTFLLPTLPSPPCAPTAAPQTKSVRRRAICLRSLTPTVVHLCVRETRPSSAAFEARPS